MTEEEIIFEEFEDDLHEEIANDINFQSIDYHDAFKPLDEFVQTEEGAKLYKKALDDINRPHPHMGVVVNDYHDKLMHDIGVWHSTVLPQITDRADEKVHNPSTTGDNMSDPREGEEDEPPIDEESSITSQSTGHNNKEEQV
tara:strand:+ start:336 stop:761 length:426 start_codon:yes stop_codon:yes gene_type:complete